MVEGDLILNRYRPIEVKGQGASGTVEICWDTRIQRRVAIKRLPLQAPQGSDEMPGLAEARMAAMLKHPAIVSVYDFQTNLDEAFLIMEAIEGPTLTQLIDEAPERMMSLDTAAAVASAVGDALDYAHSNQLLHLDIKPDNILIDTSGQVKVSDFGVSELVDPQGFTGAKGGTIGYMPPEQMRCQDLDQRCDEFALAMVIYEMLTGERPFKAASVDESLRLVERFDIAAPSDIRGDVDPRIDDVLLSALDPNREERYMTVLDFVDALMPYLGDIDRGSAELRGEEPETDIVSATDPTMVINPHAGNAGSTMLFDSVSEYQKDHPEPQPAPEPAPKPRGSRKRAIVTRVLAFVLCWVLTSIGVLPISLIDFWSGLGIGCVVGIVGAIFPIAGAVAAFGVYGITNVYLGAYPVLSHTGSTEWGLLALGLAWLLSALLMIWAYARQRRVSSVLGALLAAAVPVAALALLTLYLTRYAEVIQLKWAIPAAVVTVCLALVGVLSRTRKRKEN